MKAELLLRKKESTSSLNEFGMLRIAVEGDSDLAMNLVNLIRFMVKRQDPPWKGWEEGP